MVSLRPFASPVKIDSNIFNQAYQAGVRENERQHTKIFVYFGKARICEPDRNKRKNNKVT
jgi:hypothetical protein